MRVPDSIPLVSGRRHERTKLSARKVARERAAIRRHVAQRTLELRDESQVVPTQGDLICFNVALRPC
jgi:hypothetical protein